MADTSNSTLDEILEKWETLREEGIATSVTELCAGHPELVAGVREQIASLLEVDDVAGLSSKQDFKQPESIGRYQVIQELGRGGSSVVYLCQQQRPSRKVAVKLFLPSASIFQQRFEREADILGNLDHPGLAKVFDFGRTEAGTSFVVMEYVKGSTLRDHVLAMGPTHRERLELLRQLLDAVSYAHECGVVHRDIKPTNVLVEDGGRLKLIDFGIAKLTGGSIESITTKAQLNSVLGTLSYMAPEQIEASSKVDYRADVYSVGVTAYEMFAGRLPLRTTGMSFSEALAVAANTERTRLSDVASDVSADVEAVVHKAIQKSLADRYQSAREFSDDVERILQGLPVTASKLSGLWSFAGKVQNKRLIAAVAIVAALLLTVLGGVTLRNQHLVARQRMDDAVNSLMAAAPDEIASVVAEIRSSNLLSESYLVSKGESLHRNQRVRLMALHPSGDFVDALSREPVKEFLSLYGFADEDSIEESQAELVHLAGDEATNEPVRINAALLLLKLGEKNVGRDVLSFLADRVLLERETFLKSGGAIDLTSLLPFWLERYAEADEKNAEVRGPLVEVIKWQGMKSSSHLFSAVKLALATELKELAPVLLADRSKALSLCRDVINTADQTESLAAKRALANAVSLRLKLGVSKGLWPHFEVSTDPAVRTMVIHRCAELEVPAELLLKQLLQESDIRAGLYFALGEYGQKLTLKTKEQLLVQARADFLAHNDVGVRGAAEWVLRTYGQQAWIEGVQNDGKMNSQQGSFVNTLGQRFVVFEPATATIGSENKAIESFNPRREVEIQHRFAVSAFELERRYFRQFVKESGLDRGFDDSIIKSEDTPESLLLLDQVASYCNWLSKATGLQPSEWCYDEKFELKPDYQERTGYRLPTAIEWEYACRGNTLTETYWGDVHEHALKYAHIEQEEVLPGLHDVSGEDIKFVINPSGRLKPNDFGLFDMFGNNAEMVIRTGNQAQDAPDYLMLKGFPLQQSRIRLTAAGRQLAPKNVLLIGCGCRLARTMPSQR